MRLVTRNIDAVGISLKSGVAVLPLCFFLLCAGNLLGQVETGRITGTVTDPSGAVLPKVAVTIVAVQTNRRQEVVSDSDCRYSSGPLQVGTYRIEAQAAGF